jgi:hypothetical protein
VAAALKTTKPYAGKLARDVASKRLATLGADLLDARAVLAPGVPIFQFCLPGVYSE